VNYCIILNLSFSSGHQHTRCWSDGYFDGR